ncbi:MAG: nuclear transport factor 2 family protein [Steroidobacteraceae bacterium]
MITPNTPNERTVLDFFAALSRGDLAAVRAMLHEDATWTAQVREVPGAGTHRGHKGIVDEFLTPVRGLFAPGDPKVIIDSIASNGPLVMLESRGSGHLRDGREYANLYAWAVEVRDGKIAVIREYMDSHYVMGLFS